MKPILLLLAACLLYTTSQAQTIKGKTNTGAVNIPDNTEPDTEKPKINLSSYAKTTPDAQITINGTVEDASGVSLISITNTFTNKPIEIIENKNSFSKSIDLAEGNNQFRIKAIDKAGNTSEFVFSIQRTVERRDLALVFTIQNYPSEKLNNVNYDAQRLKNELENQYNFKVDMVPETNIETIKQKLKTYAAKTYLPTDQLLIYYSGHGTAETMGTKNKGYFIDANKQTLSHSDFIDFVDAIPCEHILIITDACYSGLMELSHTKNELLEALIKKNQTLNKTQTQIAVENLKQKSRLLLASGESTTQTGREGEGSRFMNSIIASLQTNDPDKVIEFAEIANKLTKPAVKGVIKADIYNGNFIFIKK